MNKCAKHGTQISSALASTIEAENVAAEDEIHILRYMEKDDLDSHESLLDNATNNAMITLNLKNKTEVQKDTIPQKQYCINMRKLNSVHGKMVMYGYE